MNNRFESYTPSNQKKGPENSFDYKAQKQAEKMKSNANAPHTLAGVLDAAESIIGETNWDLPNGKRLESNLPTLDKELPELSDIMKSIAQVGGTDKVNKFLKENGFNIQLRDIKDSDILAVANALKISIEWDDNLNAQKSSMNIYNNGADGRRDYENPTEVPSVLMDNVKDIYRIDSHRYPIIKLTTQSKDNVYITKLDGIPPQGSIGIHEMVSDWQSNLTYNNKQEVGPQGYYSGKVEFPMVDYNRSGNIHELLGGSPEIEPLTIIDEALYQHILQINEKGAMAKAVGAAQMTRGFGNQPVIIDGAFVVWFERDGVIPFSAYISPEDMKNPGNYETNQVQRKIKTLQTKEEQIDTKTLEIRRKLETGDYTPNEFFETNEVLYDYVYSNFFDLNIITDEILSHFKDKIREYLEKYGIELKDYFKVGIKNGEFYIEPEYIKNNFKGKSFNIYNDAKIARKLETGDYTPNEIFETNQALYNHILSNYSNENIVTDKMLFHFKDKIREHLSKMGITPTDKFKVGIRENAYFAIDAKYLNTVTDIDIPFGNN